MTILLWVVVARASTTLGRGCAGSPILTNNSTARDHYLFGRHHSFVLTEFVLCLFGRVSGLGPIWAPSASRGTPTPKIARSLGRIGGPQIMWKFEEYGSMRRNLTMDDRALVGYR